MKRKLILFALLGIVTNTSAQSERLQFHIGNFQATKAAYNELFEPFIR